ncbi:hypothetical protein VCSRO55_0670 [Vibrio cholerae]|uniref:hypothetical protein n=1 Tax=Vibrio cholerae TaxID=666 RepID=UPI0011D67A6E|nr:hypothetical protein [Vibrio cholerae]EGR2496675.1 hypothetical protein [Vibrio cholerae]TXZ57306.1 hypothetical protein FXE54_03235 [Vibrio cholerae]GHW19709.1 hypothetical protein VCSRO55_0670 [Vibrio cholerae]
MRGNATIVNSKDDAEKAGLTTEQIIEMATIVVRHDDAAYPDNYDTNLKESDDGYIEPIWQFEEEINQAVLERFGVGG